MNLVKEKISRRQIILKSLQEGKNTDQIVEEVMKAFPSADQKKVKVQISNNKNFLNKKGN